jgi:hypothetical protein
MAKSEFEWKHGMSEYGATPSDIVGAEILEHGRDLYDQLCCMASHAIYKRYGCSTYISAPSSSIRDPPMCPITFANEMRAGVERGDLAFTASADMEMVIKKYEQGFISAFDNINPSSAMQRAITYDWLGWSDNEVRVLISACYYAVEHCKFPHGRVSIYVARNPISPEMRKTLQALDRSPEFRGKIHFPK